MYFKRSFFICRHIVSYRDDGLGIIRSKSPRSAENTAKYLIKLFKQNGFKIITESGFFQTNFLDVSFNMLNSSYQPYNKPNSPIFYINYNSKFSFIHTFLESAFVVLSQNLNDYHFKDQKGVKNT